VIPEAIYYTDASFKDESGMGSWAYVEEVRDKQYTCNHGLGTFRNSAIAELESFLKLLEFTEYKNIEVFTDCQYVRDAFENAPLGIGEFSEKLVQLIGDKSIKLHCLSSRGPNKNKGQWGIVKAHRLARTALLWHLDKTVDPLSCPICLNSDVAVSGTFFSKKRVVCSGCGTKGPEHLRKPVREWNRRKFQEYHLKYKTGCMFCGHLLVTRKDKKVRCVGCRALTVPDVVS
jgi:ribonuclease HI